MTEIALATVVSPEKKQEFPAAIEQLSLGVGRFATYGSVIGNNDLVVFMACWDSEDVRMFPTLRIREGLLTSKEELACNSQGISIDIAIGERCEGEGICFGRL